MSGSKFFTYEQWIKNSLKYSSLNISSCSIVIHSITFLPKLLQTGGFLAFIILAAESSSLNSLALWYIIHCSQCKNWRASLLLSSSSGWNRIGFATKLARWNCENGDWVFQKKVNFSSLLLLSILEISEEIAKTRAHCFVSSSNQNYLQPKCVQYLYWSPPLIMHTTSERCHYLQFYCM